MEPRVRTVAAVAKTAAASAGRDTLVAPAQSTQTARQRALRKLEPVK